ncbi:MAG TPA: hypothetical protein VGY76_04035 [Solirubrobacteraceae bacterium]|nr:hypothetical protein [Solirubrobacteraceae bacterium]
MWAVALKPEYQPTLAQLLAPGWRRATKAMRVLVLALLAAFLVGVGALTLTLLPAHIAYGGPVPFGFSYRGLYRVAPDAGQDVKVTRRSASGRLLDSFAVSALTLPPYAGALSGELPLYAVGYIHSLAAKYADFQLRGEGKAHVATGATAYNIYYSVLLAGQKLYGRDVLLLPERPAARQGVAISMLSSSRSNRQVTSPLLVATAGLLYEPYRTFSFS